MNDNTIKFVVPEDSSEEMKTILTCLLYTSDAADE